ncbi:MAG: PA0069 family radical SAM protein [Verrucomicrobiaceae bacterium]|nr:PA0069 family radical SAM protein [Verrucomicrobiaceae bacterium]
MPIHLSHRGRGTIENPPNRFEATSIVSDDGAWEEIARTDPDFAPRRTPTTYLRDESRTLISRNHSPDIGFSHSLNPYRGCEHGCAYCYARSYHEYLGYNAGLDFESRIMVKDKAPELLEAELAKKAWRPVALACSGVTDCYQPLERELQITRGCLAVLADFRNPVGLITKNALVTRDLDLLGELASHRAAQVVLSLTTLDPALSSILEPRASRPAARLEAMRLLSAAGIPVGVSLAPIIPGLNEHEIPALMQAAADHGASFASAALLRLPHAVKDIFAAWLDQFAPGKKDLILNRIRETRGGALNDSTFGRRMSGTGPLAEQIGQLVEISKRRAGFPDREKNFTHSRLSTAAFRRRLPGQMELF